MNEPKNDIQAKYSLSKAKLSVYIIFSAIIILLCAIIFIYNYRIAYYHSTEGGFIPKSFGVVVKYFVLSLFALVSALILKIIYKHKVSMLLLIALSVILPILCYQVNYHGFKKNSVLYPLVNEGGALHFLTIHDFDFDGVDDGLDYTGEDVRELSSSVYCFDHQGILSRIDHTIVGKGGKLGNSWCSYHDDYVTLHLYKSRVTYDYIKITIVLTDQTDASNVALYLSDKKLNATVESENSISVVFDADTCKEWQESSFDEMITVSIRYALGE